MCDSLFFPSVSVLATFIVQEITTALFLSAYLSLILHILVNVSYKQPLRSMPRELNEGIITPSFPEIQLVVLSVI